MCRFPWICAWKSAASFLADFFLDGLVADYMVQSKIADAREQVDDAINRIETILADVRNRMNVEV